MTTTPGPIASRAPPGSSTRVSVVDVPVRRTKLALSSCPSRDATGIVPSGTSAVLTPEPESELDHPKPRTANGCAAVAATGAVVGGVERVGGGLNVVGAGAGVKLADGAGRVVGVTAAGFGTVVEG